MGIGNKGSKLLQAGFSLISRTFTRRRAALVSGSGCRNEIVGLLEKYSVSKPLVITNANLATLGVSGMVTDVIASGGLDFAFFSEIEENPTVSTVNKIRLLYNQDDCDGIVAIGGSAVIDAAKAGGARIAHPTKSVLRMSGFMKIRKKLPVIIAVPVAAGAGSETSGAAFITEKKSRRLNILLDKSLIPRCTLLDPDLTRSLRPSLIAAAGLDALSHAVETLLSRTTLSRECREYAYDAARLIFTHLEHAARDPENIEGRLALMEASYKAGVAYMRLGVGNLHAIAHSIGGMYDIPQGIVAAVLLPTMLESYGSAVYRALASIFKAIDLGHCAPRAGRADLVSTDEASSPSTPYTPNGRNPAGKPFSRTSQTQYAQGFIQAIRELNRRMYVPDLIEEVKPEDISRLAQRALKAVRSAYPVSVPMSRSDFSRIIGRISS
jgi:alcohol dehydrogenase class IV